MHRWLPCRPQWHSCCSATTLCISRFSIQRPYIMSLILNKIPCHSPRVLLEADVPDMDDQRLSSLYPQYYDPLYFLEIHADVFSTISSVSAWLHFYLIILFMIMTSYGQGCWLGGNFHKPRPHDGAALFLPSTTYNGNNIYAVYEFLHPDDSELKVQVILAMEMPMDIILGFHSSKSFITNTCTFRSLTLAIPMNIVAYDTIISLYPKATFGLRINCMKFGDCHATVTGRSKYTKCSWNLFLDSSAAASADLHVVERYIGDWHCWVVKLPKLHSRYDYLDVKHCSINGHSWALTYLMPMMGFVMQYSSLFLPQLDYTVCASKTVMSMYQREMISWYCHISLLWSSLTTGSQVAATFCEARARVVGHCCCHTWPCFWAVWWWPHYVSFKCQLQSVLGHINGTLLVVVQLFNFSWNYTYNSSIGSNWLMTVWLINQGLQKKLPI